MKRILVGLDHSPRARLVLERAAAIAKAESAELYLLRVIALPVGIPADAFRTSPGELVAQWRRDSVRELEIEAASIDPTLVVHVLVRTGSPWAAICAGAAEHDVDLVVIGSHGYRPIERALGTTAAKVVNHTDRSVLVVREEISLDLRAPSSHDGHVSATSVR
jgi:nucleotide-binding universal stress UspA family protein